MDVDSEVETSNNVLPEGFFDDPIMDAKVIFSRLFIISNLVDLEGSLQFAFLAIDQNIRKSKKTS